MFQYLESNKKKFLQTKLGLDGRDGLSGVGVDGVISKIKNDFYDVIKVIKRSLKFIIVFFSL